MVLCPQDSPGKSWSGLPFPPPGDLPNPGMECASPALQADSLLLSHWGSPQSQDTKGKNQSLMKSMYVWKDLDTHYAHL